jgi:hypothetical protein
LFSEIESRARPHRIRSFGVLLALAGFSVTALAAA